MARTSSAPDEGFASAKIDPLSMTSGMPSTPASSRERPFELEPNIEKTQADGRLAYFPQELVRSDGFDILDW
jgi:hypothetical protein